MPRISRRCPGTARPGDDAQSRAAVAGSWSKLPRRRCRRECGATHARRSNGRSATAVGSPTCQIISSRTRASETNPIERGSPVLSAWQLAAAVLTQEPLTKAPLRDQRYWIGLSLNLPPWYNPPNRSVRMNFHGLVADQRGRQHEARRNRPGRRGDRWNRLRTFHNLRSR